MARAPSFSASAISAATRAREAGSVRARLGGDRREGLLGRRNVAREHPLLGAQELVVVAIRRLLRGEVRVRLRGLGMLACCCQALRMLLRETGAGCSGFIRLQPAKLTDSIAAKAMAATREDDARVVARGVAPRTGRGRREIAAIPCIPAHPDLKQSEEYSDKRGSGSPLRRGDADRQSGRSVRSRARHAAALRADRGRGHPPHGRAARGISASRRR